MGYGGRGRGNGVWREREEGEGGREKKGEWGMEGEGGREREGREREGEFVQQWQLCIVAHQSLVLPWPSCPGLL